MVSIVTMVTMVTMVTLSVQIKMDLTSTCVVYLVTDQKVAKSGSKRLKVPESAIILD